MDTSNMNLPAAPKLRGDTILHVFTHSSLLFPGSATNGERGRLAVLGLSILDAATTYALFKKRPILSGEEIDNVRKSALSDDSIRHWVTEYSFRNKVRCTPDALHTLDTPEENRELFSSYIGAIYEQNNMDLVQNWIGRLVDPESPPPAMDMDYEPSAPVQTVQSSAAFLPLFNQKAAQHHIGVEYSASFAGPPHAGQWTAQCIVNGTQKGEGTGNSKQLAKEEAARQAYCAMGWDSESSRT